jgi:hypothetical protein
MPLNYRRLVCAGRRSWLNLSKSGASMSRKVGRFTLAVAGSLRFGRGLSFRWGRR